MIGGKYPLQLSPGHPGRGSSAAQATNAHEFVASLPQGYLALVRERAVELPGQQRQRISIARALLTNPRILVLGEATSSLDSQSETQVQEVLDKLIKGSIAFVIADCISTVQKAD